MRVHAHADRDADKRPQWYSTADRNIGAHADIATDHAAYDISYCQPDIRTNTEPYGPAHAAGQLDGT